MGSCCVSRDRRKVADEITVSLLQTRFSCRGLKRDCDVFWLFDFYFILKVSVILYIKSLSSPNAFPFPHPALMVATEPHCTKCLQLAQQSQTTWAKLFARVFYCSDQQLKQLEQFQKTLCIPVFILLWGKKFNFLFFWWKRYIYRVCEYIHLV